MRAMHERRMYQTPATRWSAPVILIENIRAIRLQCLSGAPACAPQKACLKALLTSSSLRNIKSRSDVLPAPWLPATARLA